MATETLRLDIVADSAQAKAELQKLNNQLAIFERAVKKSTDPAQIQYLNKNIEFLRGNIQTATTANQKFAQGSNQAAFALTNLGRIAQDAPFGFIGIQNNLNPMLESFQRLQQTTGSVGGALKAMASSLIGPAGLGLALSVGGAALLMFGDRLFKTDNAAKQAAESMGKLRDSAAKELVQFKKLTIVAADANIPLVQRKQAVEDLQKNYPAYLGNLSQEDILAGKIGNAYDQITNALRAKIALQAAEERVIPLIKQQLELAEKIANADKQIELAKKDKINTTEADIRAQQEFARATGKGAVTLSGSIQAQGKAAKVLKDELTPAYNELNNQINKVFNTMKPFIEASNGLNEEYDKQKNKVTELKDEVANYIKELLYLRTIQKQGMRDVSARPVLAGDYSNPEVNISQDMVARTLATQQATKTQLDYANALRLTTMNEEAAAAMTNVAMSAFNSLGRAMLMGQDIGEALGNTFKRLVVDLTAMVARALIFKAILKSLELGATGGASAATGGGGFFGFLKGLMGFADGGIASGPKSGYPVMLHGTEAVLNPKQFKNLTSNMMNIGAARGGGMMNVQVEGILRGQDIVLQRTRAERALGLRRG
jgi:hypothetical protein